MASGITYFLQLIIIDAYVTYYSMRRNHFKTVYMREACLEEVVTLQKYAIFWVFLQMAQLIYKIYAFLIYQSIARNVGFLWVTLMLHLITYVERYGVFPGLN